MAANATLLKGCKMVVRKRSEQLLVASNAVNRRQMSQALVIISTGIFLLAVLFSMVRGIGFFVSLGLLVAGCFSMIIVGIMRESAKDNSLAAQKVKAPESDDIFA
jgi:predicted membrane protein